MQTQNLLSKKASLPAPTGPVGKEDLMQSEVKPATKTVQEPAAEVDCRTESESVKSKSVDPETAEKPSAENSVEEVAKIDEPGKVEPTEDSAKVGEKPEPEIPVTEEKEPEAEKKVEVTAEAAADSTSKKRPLEEVEVPQRENADEKVESASLSKKLKEAS